MIKHKHTYAWSLKQWDSVRHPLILIVNADYGTYILDDNSEIGAYVRSNLCYLICLRHLIRSRAVKNQVFPLHARKTCSEIPSEISAKVLGHELTDTMSSNYTKDTHHPTLSPFLEVYRLICPFYLSEIGVIASIYLSIGLVKLIILQSKWRLKQQKFIWSSNLV